MYESLAAMMAQYPPVDVLEAIIKRHTVHEFKPEPVPLEILLALIDACRQAPSSRNLQPWEFVIVTDQAVKDSLAPAMIPHNDDIVKNAGATVVCLGSMQQQDRLADEYEKRWLTPDATPEVVERTQRSLKRMREDQQFRREHVLHSTFIGIGQMVLAAMKFGLGTVTMGGFIEGQIKEILGIPGEYMVAAMVGVGWPAHPDAVKTRVRRPLEETYWLNHFGGTTRE